MRHLSIKSKVILFIYLMITGIIAINVHIQMMNMGVSDPEWEPPVWVDTLCFAIQALGFQWLTKLIFKCNRKLSLIKHWAIVFITMSALQELLFRLPLSAGYVTDQKYLFIWVHSYLPELLMTFALTIIMVLLQRIFTSHHYYVKYIVIVGVASLGFLFLQPIIQQNIHSLLEFIPPPDPSGQLQTPYPWQVEAIASFTFIEPVLAALFICYLLSKGKQQTYLGLSLKTVIALMVLTQQGATFIFYLYYSTIDDMSERLLSISQFTLEFVVVGLGVTAAVIYTNKIKRSSLTRVRS
ncbi:hypothetical protein L1D16_20710 [Vibrio sp. Isolate31]|uniref:hypothetical protein n=1 Tax=unclassified Vibrio TaxID=2614977 RepID=UPI001EFEB287|nr:MULTISPECIES: hypothetical protein [unclassified Vibrio]MCG9555626.1 hypothetical protein [Vibrio sp. Isolate32]MCG9603162.1 hypothetical protein [Vibrio sp. Isolate31]